MLIEVCALSREWSSEEAEAGAGTGYIQDEGRQRAGGFWTIEYYQPYFDVDTTTVRHNPLDNSPTITHVPHRS